MAKLTLRQARMNKQMTVKEAAALAGIAPSTLRRWEKDCTKATCHLFIKLERAYNIGLDHIHIGKEDKTHEPQ